MNGSINFLFHLIGFGFIFTALLGGWILERRIRAEKEWSQKLYLGKTSRRFGLLSPIASIIMLLTGIVNIFNMYNGNIHLWYTEGWLIAKIILFAFLLINGAVFGPEHMPWEKLMPTPAIRTFAESLGISYNMGL